MRKVSLLCNRILVLNALEKGGDHWQSSIKAGDKGEDFIS